MTAAGPRGSPLYGLPPAALGPQESVLRHWTAPEGRALLTNHRLVMLSRPRPLRRRVEWTLDLEGVRSLGVAKVRGLVRTRVSMRGGIGGGVIGPGRIDPTYSVVVNGTDVFIGDPQACQEVQAWIDDARTARCVARFGRMIPFQQG